jgi:alpha-tubulin suppressor-like RCC1 family protein
VKIKYFETLRKNNPDEQVIKIDSGEDYTAALTKSGNIYAWGLNNQGQLGTGGGSGKDYVEIEKCPTIVIKNTPVKFVDFSCGENTMIIKDDKGHLHKTGLKLNYTPGLIESSVNIKAKSFFCGRSFYCMIDSK